MLHRYLEAAGLKDIPKDLGRLRYAPLSEQTVASRKAWVDNMTGLWCSGSDDNQRKANASSFSLDVKAQRTLRYYFADHQRLPPGQIEKSTRHIQASAPSSSLLTESEKRDLDELGYLNLGILLDDRSLDSLRERLDTRVESEGSNAGHEVSQTQGIARLSGTVVKTLNSDGLLDVFFSHPRLLACVQHLLGQQFKLSSSNFHAPLPGYGAQAMHADWGWGVTQPEVVNAIWMLDDFTPDNGPTRVVPKSHRWGKHPVGSAFNEVPSALFQPIENEIHLTGKAGTCVVYNAHLWHSGTQNRTDSLRRALHSFFTKAKRPPQTDVMPLIDKQVWSRFSATQRALLDLPPP